jgi:hypothetical protein
MNHGKHGKHGSGRRNTGPFSVLSVFSVTKQTWVPLRGEAVSQGYIPISSALRTVFMTMRIEAASTIVPLTLTEPSPSDSALS